MRAQEPKQNRTTTREKIIDSALTLFAERGYDGVGVDAIAENVGLKGPSIYKHFKSKEQIMDTLISDVAIYYEENFGSEVHPGKIPASVEELIEISLKRMEFTLHDDRIKRVRKILVMEQFRNPKIARLTTSHMMGSVQKLYCYIFSEMMNAGVIPGEDPAMLSMAFTAPITLLINRCDREPMQEKEVMDCARQYMEFFSKSFFWNNGR